MTEDPPNEKSAADGTVLSPDELDISEEDSVVELEDGRYVISPAGAEPEVSSEVERSTETASEPDQTTDAGTADDDETARAPINDAEVYRWLEERLASNDSQYAFDVSAKFEDQHSQKILFSNDVVSTFENLVVWYATHAGGDTPVEDVLGILLTESNLPIRFPAESLRRFAESQGLDGRDSLDDLYAAANRSGGIRFTGEDD